jgi:hypothetical protein
MERHSGSVHQPLLLEAFHQLAHSRWTSPAYLRVAVAIVVVGLIVCARLIPALQDALSTFAR